MEGTVSDSYTYEGQDLPRTYKYGKFTSAKVAWSLKGIGPTKMVNLVMKGTWNILYIYIYVLLEPMFIYNMAPYLRVHI